MRRVLVSLRVSIQRESWWSGAKAIASSVAGSGASDLVRMNSFFDGPGFNPRTGEALKSFTREDASSYFEEVKKEADRLKAEQDRADQEKAQREQEDTIARQKRKDEQRKREAEARQRTQSARECDELAGNPNDPRRVAAGIGFDLLKAHAQEAIKACDSAVQQNPTELRLRYEFARALSFTDRDMAFKILQGLIKQGYPSAYDNLGWWYYQDKHDPAQAVSLFRKGVRAGDPDAMLSLAEMISRGHTTPANATETPLELYRQAAQLGSADGAKAYNAQLANEHQAEQHRTIQFEKQRQMMNFMLGVLQNIPRR